MYELYLGRRDGGWVKSSEVNFEVVREAAGCVDGAPARQPAPSRVSFRALESCIRASALLSSIANCRDEWNQIDLSQIGD